jgi:hypothetical protein
MTDAEWLACDDPEAMLGVFSDRPEFSLWGLVGFPGRRREPSPQPAQRLLALAATAFCRLLRPFARDDLRPVLDWIESPDAVPRPYWFLRGIPTRSYRGPSDQYAGWAVEQAVSFLDSGVAEKRYAPLDEELLFSWSPPPARRSGAEALRLIANNARRAVEEHAGPDGAAEAGQAAARWQARVLRCVLSNPFRPPPPLAPSLLDWEGGLLRQLALACCEHGSLPWGHLDAARLAVLSDALEESGCTDTDLLAHLRSAGPHVRGCRAVDLVLGKS